MKKDPKYTYKTIRVLSEFRDTSNLLVRTWIGILTPVEFAVVMFIHARTIGFGNAEAKICGRHFTEGVIDKAGFQWQSPLKISIRHLRRVLASLQKRKIINAVRGKQYEWTTYSLNLDTLREATPVITEGTLMSYGDDMPVIQDQDRICQEQKDQARIPKGILARRGKSWKLFLRKKAEIGVSDAKSKNVCRNSEIQAKARKEGKIGKSELASHIAQWNKEMRRYYPNVPEYAWRVREISALKKYWNLAMKNFKHTTNFIETVISQWDAIIKTKCRGLRNAPTVPDPMFMIKYMPHFMDAYNMMANGLEIKPDFKCKTEFSNQNLIGVIRRQGEDLDMKNRELHRLKGRNETLEIIAEQSMRQAKIVPPEDQALKKRLGEEWEAFNASR